MSDRTTSIVMTEHFLGRKRNKNEFQKLQVENELHLGSKQNLNICEMKTRDENEIHLILSSQNLHVMLQFPLENLCDTTGHVMSCTMTEAFAQP